MATDEKWEALAKGLLKAELKRRNMTYAHLVSRLAEKGVKEEEHNLRNKVARGKFTAAFFLQCLDAIGAKDVRLDSALGIFCEGFGRVLREKLACRAKVNCARR